MKISSAFQISAACLTVVACGQRPDTGWSGYAEGEAIHLAAPVAGRLVELPAQKGLTIAQGAPAFRLENGAEQALGAELSAREQGAKSQARDTTKGQRAAELRVTEAQLQQAQVKLQQAEEELARQRKLVQEGYGTRAKLDDAVLARSEAQSKVEELQARLRAAQLPAREDLRASASSTAEAAVFSRSQSEWRLRQLQQSAPQSGVVTDVFYRVGEWVEAGRPVLSLLPPVARKARFFAPQQELAQLPLGAKVAVTCDGCGPALFARVVHVAAEPEYTPPVIYSNSQRSKLVFRVEAVAERTEDAARLRPGQPLTVRVASGS